MRNDSTVQINRKTVVFVSRWRLMKSSRLHPPYTRTQEVWAHPSSSARSSSLVLQRVHIQRCKPRTPKHCETCRVYEGHCWTVIWKSRSGLTLSCLSKCRSFPKPGSASPICTLRWTNFQMNKWAWNDSVSHTISLMPIFQWRWMDQEAKTLAAHVTTCMRLRYVFCRNENLNWSFWQIDTSARVVPIP